MIKEYKLLLETAEKVKEARAKLAVQTKESKKSKSKSVVVDSNTYFGKVKVPDPILNESDEEDEKPKKKHKTKQVLNESEEDEKPKKKHKTKAVKTEDSVVEENSDIEVENNVEEVFKYFHH